MQTLSNDLSTFLSGAYANRFSLDNRSYKVIPQVQRTDRLNPEQLEGYYTRAGNGQLIPLSTLIQLEDSKREAIEEASAIRLRPVLMTTAALVLAMLPLLTATGPGAVARFSMGLIIAAGMTIGTLFTLYVLPAVYLYLGRDYHADRRTLDNESVGGYNAL